MEETAFCEAGLANPNMTKAATASSAIADVPVYEFVETLADAVIPMFFTLFFWVYCLFLHLWIVFLKKKEQEERYV